MFTGITETTGIIKHLEMVKDCLNINVSPHIKFSDLKIGDSVSVNGVCLTVTKLLNDTFDATIVPETMRLSNLGQLAIGSLVNLERSLKSGDRIGGHYVQGHVDSIAEIISLEKDGEDALLLKISIPQRLAKYIVNKGYIALDGMSVTVIEATDEWFTITLIPHTQQVSIACNYSLGTKVNIEVDILSKYVEKLLKIK